MKVSVLLEQRFKQSADGAILTPGPFPHSFFERYLDVFDAVDVVARVDSTDCASTIWRRADGPGVRFRSVPHYHGPLEYLRSLYAIRRGLHAALHDADAVVLRVPSQLANSVEPWLRRRAVPYALEIVGDPYDAFSSEACAHPLRRVFQHVHTSRLRRQCARAELSAYVTSAALQLCYPPGVHTDHTHYSSVELPEEAFAETSRVFSQGKQSISLITVGSLAHRYKGLDVLISALATLGPRYNLTIVGDGNERAALEQQADRLGVVVRFRGQLPAGPAVIEELDRADVFVLPSRQEGLPRALLEAMARGLPCVACDVGGCRELVPPECLSPPNDALALARVIRLIAGNPDTAARLARQNLLKAHDFSEACIRPRRARLYRQLRRRAERRTAVAWCNTPANAVPPAADR